MAIAVFQSFKKSGLPPTERFVAMMLADHLNSSTGRCDPSLSLIAEETGYSKRAVELAIQRLEDKGFVSVKRAEGVRNSYVLHPPTSEATSPVNQRSTFASEGGSPAKHVRRTSEPDSLPPAKEVRYTSEGGSPESERTVRETVTNPEPADVRTPNGKLAEAITSAYPLNGNRFEAMRSVLAAMDSGEDGEFILQCVKIHAQRYHSLPRHRQQYAPALHTYFLEGRWRDNPDRSPWVHVAPPNSQNGHQSKLIVPRS